MKDKSIALILYAWTAVIIAFSMIIIDELVGLNRIIVATVLFAGFIVSVYVIWAMFRWLMKDDSEECL